MDIRSVTRFVRVSPQRTRHVVNLIRGVKVNAAMSTLNFTNTKAAKIVTKTLKSAIANAKQQEIEDLDRLFVKEAFVDEGPIMRRFIARAMGRATRLRKRTAHITIILSDGSKEEAHVHHHEAQGKPHEIKDGDKDKHEKDIKKKDLKGPTGKDKKLRLKALDKFVRVKDQKKVGAHEKKGMS